MKKGLILFFGLLFGLDIASKALAIQWIPPLSSSTYPFGGIGIFSLGQITCSLNYAINSGAAWGTFQGNAGLLFILRCAIILALFFFGPKRFAKGLILTGAICNIIDYCLYRHVIDFIHFTFWGYSFPIFNVADSCITIGILLLLFFPKHPKAEVV